MIIGGEFFEEKGFRYDEEKEAVNRPGMKMAVGVYPDR